SIKTRISQLHKIKGRRPKVFRFTPNFTHLPHEVVRNYVAKAKLISIKTKISQLHKIKGRRPKEKRPNTNRNSNTNIIRKLVLLFKQL
ncbi:hypothetical protein GIB67_000603, partial [Kingdonia uniflora]